MSSSYERELRRVLSGDEKTINSITRSCNQLEKLQILSVMDKPFLVVRAAGSGMEGSGDLVALRGDICFPIEVKSTKSKKLYLSGRTKTQYLSMLKEGEKTGLMPLYAHRLKGVRGDSWRRRRAFKGDLHGNHVVSFCLSFFAATYTNPTSLPPSHAGTRRLGAPMHVHDQRFGRNKLPTCLVNRIFVRL